MVELVRDILGEFNAGRNQEPGALQVAHRRFQPYYKTKELKPETKQRT
jgi:hypothetical protein